VVSHLSEAEPAQSYRAAREKFLSQIGWEPVTCYFTR